MNKINQLYQTHVSYELRSLHKPANELLNKSLIDLKVMAFLSEIGKISEESRYFSFWDTSTLDDQLLLSNYIDGLQILLSIGFELRVDAIKQYHEVHQETKLVDQFLKLYHATLKLQKSYHFEDYQNVIDDFFHLGFLLDYDINQIIEAYKQHI
jgi:dimeric dUTPase (all-alpha-NTP-PPase superfamily)